MTDIKRAYLALGAICVIWGTTYTAIKYALADFPPFLLVGLRQSMAGLLLLILALYRRKAAWPGWSYIWKQSITGIATITGGNGFITWGVQFVSTGLAALIGSLTPVMVVIITLLWKGTDKVTPRILLGVAMGFGGLALIFNHGWADFIRPEYRWGIAACFLSCFTWSLGTVMAKRWNSPDISPLFNAGIQIFAGGLGGFVLSLFFDHDKTVHHSLAGWASLIYLILIGSALAFTFYMFALKHLSASVSSMYTYINPIVAILLGWLLLGEELTIWTGIGMSITIFGVWLVNSAALRNYRQMKKLQKANRLNA
ncbi:MAG: EamA family transporter [Lewinellaceae bacterium]|nr:EamA family transporter [Lewinellaceae bacterium]